MIFKKPHTRRYELLRHLFVSVCVCFMPALGIAQHGALENEDEGKVFKADNFGFNAIDIRQGRFLYDDRVEYRKDKFYDHMTIGAVWHYDKIHERVQQGYGAALNYGVFVEKELNKNHALRLLFYEGSYQQLEKSIRMNKYQLELMHSFNWTRFFGGYNPYRKVEAVTSLGLGAYYSERLDKKEVGPMFIISGGARMQLSPLFMLGIEPYVALAGDGVDHSGGKNYRKYDVLYGTDVSLSYTFHNELSKEEQKGFRGNTFVDFGIGAQFEPYTGFHLQPNVLPFLSTVGPQLKLGVGYWISPALAVRVSGNLSSSNWDNVHLEANKVTNHPAHDIRMKNVLVNGRFDLLFSPYRFFSGRTDNHLDVNAVVGWEYGRMIKTSYNPTDLLKTYYDGFSGGLQLRYNYDKYTALYLEPRITLANYNIPYAPPYQFYVDRYRDYLFSMMAGFEFSANEYRFLSRRNQPSKFNPNFSLSLQGGPSYLFVTKEYAGDFYMDYSMGIAGEMQLSPYSGVRIMADYSQLSNRDAYNYKQRIMVGSQPLVSDTALCTGRYGFANISADYVFNIGTLLQGYNAANRWGVALAIGPVYSQRVSLKTIIAEEEKLWEYRSEGAIATAPEVDHSRSSDYALGAQVGIPVSYHVGSHLDILFEPRARFFSRGYIDGTRSGGLSKVLNAQLGLRYVLNDRYYVQHADTLSEHFRLKSGHFFAHFGIGVQTPRAIVDLGPRVEAGIGYWLNPGVAARASANLSSHDWEEVQTLLAPAPTQDGMPINKSLRQLAAGGRFDVLLNPYGYLANRYDTQVGFNLVAGWEYGFMFRDHVTGAMVDNYNAISGGIQLRYNRDTYRSLYIEPRYSYDLKHKSGNLSMVGGIDLGADSNAFQSKKAQIGVFEPTFSLSLLGGAGYIYNRREYSDAPISDYSVGIASEYKYSPYSGTRLTIGYTGYHLRGLYNYHYKNYGLAEYLFNYRLSYLNVGADYLFDISTLLQGYEANRSWSAALAIGPQYVVRLSQSDPATDSGYRPSSGRAARLHSLGVQMGVPVSFRLGNSLGLQVEPRGRVNLTNYITGTSGRFPLMQFDALMGLRYTINQTRLDVIKKQAREAVCDNFFADFGLGVQMLGSTSLAGPRATASLGYWLNPDWALRGSLLFSAYNWKGYPTGYAEIYKKVVAGAARADVLVSPLNFFLGRTSRKFDVYALAGWEYGMAVRSRYPSGASLREYNAWSTGFQLRYNQSSSHALYLEPRYVYSTSEDIYEHLFALTAGLSFNASDYAFRSRSDQPSKFKPTFSLALTGGMDMLIRHTDYAGTSLSDLVTGVTGEFRFGPYSGLRAMINHSTLSDRVIYNNRGSVMVGDSKTGYLSFATDYLFDFGTLLRGYVSDRKWNVGIAFGPVYAHRISTYDPTSYPVLRSLSTRERTWGIQLSVPVTYNVNERVGVMLEPRGSALRHNILSNASNRPSLLMSTQLGLKYTLGNGLRDKLQDDGSVNRDFVHFAMGMQYMPDAELVLGSTGGLLLGAGLGRWFNPLWGVRFSGEIAASNHASRNGLSNKVQQAHDVLLKSARVSGRMDVMFNPLALKSNYQSTRWGASLLAGYESGISRNVLLSWVDSRTYNDFSVGAQLRYNTDEHHVLYVEPRYAFSESILAVTAGMEFSMNDHRFRSRKNQPGEFKPYYSVGFAVGVNHLFQTTTYAGTAQADFGLGLTGEYHFTPYSGLRLCCDYSHLANAGILKGELVEYGLGYLNVAPEYMFDLSTLLAGYWPGRRWGIALTTGPAFSFRMVGDQQFTKNLNTSSVGVQVAVPVQCRVNEHWSISLEPRARFFGSRYTAHNGLGGSVAKIFSAQLGFKYTF